MKQKHAPEPEGINIKIRAPKYGFDTDFPETCCTEKQII